MYYDKQLKVWQIDADMRDNIRGKFQSVLRDAMVSRTTDVKAARLKSNNMAVDGTDIDNSDLGHTPPQAGRATEVPKKASNVQSVRGSNVTGQTPKQPIDVKQVWENRFLQLMLLYGSGDIDSCRHNASDGRLLKDVKGKLDSLITNKN